MLRVSSFGSISPSPSSAGNTQGLRPAMRFRRLNCSTAGGVSGTAKATPVLVRSAAMSQTGALASRSNSDQRAPDVNASKKTAGFDHTPVAAPLGRPDNGRYATPPRYVIVRVGSHFVTQVLILEKDRSLLVAASYPALRPRELRPHERAFR